MEILKTPEKITFQMEDVNKKVHEFTVIELTKPKIKELRKLSKAESVNDDNAYDSITAQLAFYTEKEEKYFDIFHIAVLKNGLDYINREAQRPFQATQEKS